MQTIRQILIIVFSALAFVSMGANDCGISYHADIYDSATVLSISTGTQSQEVGFTYDTLGRRLSKNFGTTVTRWGWNGNVGMVPFLFQGQYYDRETGLAYNRFRYYDPKTGAYISQDPIGLAGGILNLYGYVDDTNAWFDSFGLNAKPETAKEWEHRFSKMNPDERHNAALGKLRKVARKNGWKKDSILTKKNKRETFKDDKGRIFAVDTQHGRSEYLDSRGKHLGEYNIDGRPIEGKTDKTKGHNIYMK